MVCEKTQKKRQDSRYPGRDLNPKSPEYETEMTDSNSTTTFAVVADV
jgi:hypothetical protein